MISVPTVLQKNDRDNEYSVDTFSFLLSEDVVLIDGVISSQVAEVINSTLFFLQSKKPENVTIILNNTECVEFRYVFTIYETIQLLIKSGVNVSIHINGKICDLAILIALINVEKTFSSTAMIQIKELKVDTSFDRHEIERAQAADLIAHLKYYEKLERNYFTIMSKETGIDYETIQSLHQRTNFLDKDDLIELGVRNIKQDS